VVSCQWSANASVLRPLPPPHRTTESLNHCPLTSGLGIPEDKIFTGYDAIDNAYFAARADQIRASAK
jgi:hypothetical protein